jgi:hypothetical protein
MTSISRGPASSFTAHDPAHFERILRDRIVHATAAAGAHPRPRLAGACNVTKAPSTIAYARHPARRGIAWLREAAAMLAAHRVRWLFLLLAYYVIQFLVSVVPVVGPLAMMVGRPIFTVGFLAAAWEQQRGGVPQIAHLFRGFRTNLRALIPIGIVLVAGTLFAIFATALVDGGALLDAITASSRPDEAFVCERACRSRDALRHPLRVAYAACGVVRAGTRRLSGLRCASGACDESARRSRELASPPRLRRAALLLRRGAAGDGDRADRRRRTAAVRAVRDRGNGRPVHLSFRRGAGDFRLHRVSRRLSPRRSACDAGTNAGTPTAE